MALNADPTVSIEDVDLGACKEFIQVDNVPVPVGGALNGKEVE